MITTDLSERRVVEIIDERTPLAHRSIALIRDAIDQQYLIFFEHDPLIAAGYIREKDGRRYVEQVL